MVVEGKELAVNAWSMFQATSAEGLAAKRQAAFAMISQHGWGCSEPPSVVTWRAC